MAIGCGAIGTSAADAVPVYFGTGGPGAKGIYRATFNPDNGKLTAADLVAEVGSPGFLALHPDRTKLYAVANFPGGPGAIGYTIRAGGALEVINSAPTGDGGGAHIAVHPSGKFLLTAQYGGGSTALFPLAADGKLGAAQLSKHQGGSGVVKPVQEKPHAHWVGFSPDGRFALVPDLGLDGIVIYRIDLAKPAIERHGFAASVPGGGPRHMRFSPDGKFIYLLNELSLSVTTFAWDMAAGTAPVVTDIGHARQVLRAAGAGFLIKENDTRQWIDTLVQLLTSRDMAIREGGRVRDFAREQFAYGAIAADWAGAIQKVC